MKDGPFGLRGRSWQASEELRTPSYLLRYQPLSCEVQLACRVLIEIKDILLYIYSLHYVISGALFSGLIWIVLQIMEIFPF